MDKESKINYIKSIQRDIDFIKKHCKPSKERTHAIQSLRESINIIYDPDIRLKFEDIKIKEEEIEDKAKYSTVEYRIKHKPTGLYYQPRSQKTNLSKIGKIYNNPRGWTYFKSSLNVEVNASSEIYDDILYKNLYPNLKYTQLKNYWSGTYLNIEVDLSEWEKEYIRIS